MYSSPIRILLVDDEDDYIITRSLLHEIDMAQFKLDWVSSYEEALHLMDKNQHDVYMLDYKLGKRDGLELLKHAVRNGCSGPIILLTGQGDEDIDLQALRSGAADYLVKDQISSSLLARSIRYALERKQILENLRKSEEKFRSIVETTNEWIWSIDIAGNITYTNPAITPILGYQPEEIINKSILAHIHVEDIQLFKELLSNKGNKGWTGVILRRYHKSGMVRYLESNAIPIVDQSNKVIGYQGADRNITDRMQAELNLDRFFKLSIDMLCIAGTDGYFKCLNPAFENTLGHTEEELLSKPFLDFVHEEDRAATVAQMQLLDSGLPVINFNNRYICKDGSYKWLSWSVSPVGDTLYGVARDITEIKQTEEHLAKHSQALARSNADLEQFAYVASHDLQEPLRMVASFTQLLAMRYKGRLDAEADEYIYYAVDGANRMKRIIRDLLEYSRVGRSVKDPEMVDIEDALRHVIGNLQIVITESKATITHDPLPTIIADGMQIERLLLNLLGNAIKYRSDEPPKIHISCQKGDGMWRFCVSDNGIGIPPNYVEQIFVIFQRLHTRDRYEGTGIGLAICKKIVERHGGQIWVEPGDGKGSKFFFTISI
jgi:PAS domain S-box-containing protein